MSRIVAIAGTTHTPMLGMEPATMWKLRAENDAENPELYDCNGDIRPFAELAAEAGGKYDAEITMDAKLES